MKWLPVAAAMILGAAVPETPEYVDGRVCVTCHRQIAEDYARTGMGRSLIPSSSTDAMVLGEGWLASGKPHEAVAAHSRAVELSPKSAAAWRSLAAAQEAAGDMAHASKSLTKALQIAPADPITWHKLGLLDSTANRNTAAVQEIRKAIALDPTLPEQSRALARSPAEVRTARRGAGGPAGCSAR